MRDCYLIRYFFYTNNNLNMNYISNLIMPRVRKILGTNTKRRIYQIQTIMTLMNMIKFAFIL